MTSPTDVETVPICNDSTVLSSGVGRRKHLSPFLGTVGIPFETGSKEVRTVTVVWTSGEKPPVSNGGFLTMSSCVQGYSLPFQMNVAAYRFSWTFWPAAANSLLNAFNHRNALSLAGVDKRIHPGLRPPPVC